MPIRVLVVDDEEDFLRAVVMRLGLRGMEVHGTRDGDEALRYLEGHEVDVVVLDIKMPGPDGLDTLREIKRRYPAAEVIVVTGHASLESSKKGIELGAFDYLIKPVRLSEVIERIEAAHARTAGGGPS